MISKRMLAALIVGGIPWWVLSAGAVPAPESTRGPFGFIRLVDAVSIGTGKLECLINGQAVRPEGYQLGNVTGGIALQPAAYRLAFHRQGIKSGETQVLVAANDTTILIPFAEQVPATATEPARWEIRILKLKQHQEEDHRTATLVSVSHQPELQLEIRQADGKWQRVFVKRLGIARAAIKQTRGYLAVRCGPRKLSAVSVGPAGNFVTVLYDDENGLLRSTNFQDYKYLSPEG